MTFDLASFLLGTALGLVIMVSARRRDRRAQERRRAIEAALDRIPTKRSAADIVRGTIETPEDWGDAR
jgi:hypothetical protein